MTTVTVGPVMIIGTWTPYGSLNTGRQSHTASLRPDGSVLVAGGFNRQAQSARSKSAGYPQPGHLLRL